MVLLVGLGPTQYRYYWILSPARLPIPPQEQVQEKYNKKIIHFPVKLHHFLYKLM